MTDDNLNATNTAEWQAAFRKKRFDVIGEIIGIADASENYHEFLERLRLMHELCEAELSLITRPTGPEYNLAVEHRNASVRRLRRHKAKEKKETEIS